MIILVKYDSVNINFIHTSDSFVKNLMPSDQIESIEKKKCLKKLSTIYKISDMQEVLSFLIK